MQGYSFLAIQFAQLQYFWFVFNESRQCSSCHFNFDSVTELADEIKAEFSSRMVCDFSKLNEIAVKKHHPFPLLRSIFRRCYGINQIVNIDFKSRYFDFGIEQESYKYLGIVTPWGYFNG